MVDYTYIILFYFILFYTITIFNSTDILPPINTRAGAFLKPKPKKSDEITNQEKIDRVKFL
jgi:hypothetical protein